MKDVMKDKIRAVLLKIDPIKIYFPEDNNLDEYNGEVDLIIEYLPMVKDENELSEMIYQIFKKRFGDIEPTKDKLSYKQLAKEIWNIVKEDKNN